MDLFDQSNAVTEESERRPLAARMRPRSLEDVAGQEHILGESCLLRRAIDADRLNSLILYGPPGCGKTSLAEVIARVTNRCFVRCSGVLSNVSELRSLIEQARLRFRHDSTETILFIDEIHRFNKAQQDVLLPHVEDGTVTLIGATTHNPLVFVNSPLVSRSLLFELKPLSDEAMESLIRRALTDEDGLPDIAVEIAPDAINHLIRCCEGDARRALNALEIAALTTPPGTDGKVLISSDVIADSLQRKAVVYDRDEDGHYDTISAFIKSVRGSDPDAAVYWLAKMLYAGEDPRFVARRLVILASEDIGNADPRGLTIAVAAMHAAEFVGMPEARIILSQATTYLACAPKSNAAYKAVDAALSDVENGRTLAVPEHLKNLHVPKAGEDKATPAYLYPHDAPGGFVDQAYIPAQRQYYHPGDNGYEQVMARRLAAWRKQRGSKAGGGK